MDRRAQFSCCLRKKFSNPSGDSSGREIVAMMQTAQSRHGYDLATCTGILFCHATGRRFLRQCKMRPVFVIVTDVLIHQAFQMAFIENDHMVEQIASAVANPALGNAILPRTSITCPLGLDAKHLHRIDQFLVELRAAIKDQITRRSIVRKSLAQLLNRPSIRKKTLSSTF